MNTFKSLALLIISILVHSSVHASSFKLSFNILECSCKDQARCDGPQTLDVFIEVTRSMVQKTKEYQDLDFQEIPGFISFIVPKETVAGAMGLEKTDPNAEKLMTKTLIPSNISIKFIKEKASFDLAITPIVSNEGPNNEDTVFVKDIKLDNASPMIANDPEENYSCVPGGILQAVLLKMQQAKQSSQQPLP